MRTKEKRDCQGPLGGGGCRALRVEGVGAGEGGDLGKERTTVELDSEIKLSLSEKSRDSPQR